MAQNITLLGASYPNVPSVVLPKTGGGNASFVDVSGASLSSSDGAKIPTGESAFGSDGKLIIGHMPDYANYKLLINNKAYVTYTPGTDLTVLPIPACSIGGNEISIIQIIASFNYIVTSTTSQRYYIADAVYSKIAFFSPTNTAEWRIGTVRLSRGSSQSRLDHTIFYDPYIQIQNEDQIESGNASLKFVIPSDGVVQLYWKSGVTYNIVIGG